MQPLTTLSVTRLSSGLYNFELERPPDERDPFEAPFVPFAEVKVAEEVVQTMRLRIGKAVAQTPAAAAAASENPFTIPGRALFDTLLPHNVPGAKELREVLRGLATPLLITTNDPDTPWELLHDGDGFLGLKLAVGRSLRDVGQRTKTRPIGSAQRKHRCLIVADPGEDLPSAAEEAAALEKQFTDRGFVCEKLVGPQATFDVVLNRLLSGEFAVFHFAGHIAIEEHSGEYAFWLYDGRPLRASVVETCAAAPEVVFLNGCESAQMIEGVTRAFLRAGSRLVVGSLFAAPSRGAATFSQSFYQAFLAGKPAGEALRVARRHGREAGGGAAWACFVLYGDPRFALGEDPLRAILQSAGLKRADFTVGAQADLERTCQFARPAGVAGASHLFAALMAGDDPHLPDRLRECGIRPERLSEVFRGALKEAQSSSGGSLPASPNLREILVQAKKASGAETGSAITSLDLVRGLVRVREASVWKVLRTLGVRPWDLDPDRRERSVSAVGPLSAGDCEALAWSVLRTAVTLADKTGSSTVGTAELFGALLTCAESSLQAGLSRLEIQLTADAPAPAPAKPDPAGDIVPCSPNGGDILTLAQATAAARGRPVSEADLLAAFVETGGGSMGALLQSKGIVLRCLTSQLFLPGGLLDTDRFSESAQKVLESSLEFARQKEYNCVGRRHLLYGLLSATGGGLSAKLQEQGRDSEQLADLFYATLATGGSAGAQASFRYSSIAFDLTRILCSADVSSKREGSPLVEERHLLEAWVEDGGGVAGSFLVQNGVRLRRLL